MRILSCLFACMITCTLFAHNVMPVQNPDSTQMREILLQSIEDDNFNSGDNLDLNYLRTLMVYLQGAADTSTFFIKHSTHEKTLDIAQNITKSYKNEIATLTSLLPQIAEQKRLYSPKEATLFNNQNINNKTTLIETLDGLDLGRNISTNFVLMLTPYQQHIVSISKAILQYTQIEEIKAIAEQMLATHEQILQSLQALAPPTKK